ncbi:hypothetical protein SFR_4627 [Streptomyces sp. FR-008]|nr:hypothetical protein SFR_4627 [Streptomyces sp. FR-008]
MTPRPARLCGSTAEREGAFFVLLPCVGGKSKPRKPISPGVLSG